MKLYFFDTGCLRDDIECVSFNWNGQKRIFEKLLYGNSYVRTEDFYNIKGVKCELIIEYDCGDVYDVTTHDIDQNRFFTRHDKKLEYVFQCLDKVNTFLQKYHL